MVKAQHESPARKPVYLDGQSSAQHTQLPGGSDDELTPAIPASAGALIFDRKGRLLILKPTYKSGWTIPGGVMEADGESPWEACKREVREECGLTVRAGRLACVDFRRPRPSQGRPGGIRYLFDCGRLGNAALGAIELQSDEISGYRIVKLRKALTLLRGPVRRRVSAACAVRCTVYLEDGRPVPEVDARERMR
jgi:8-oxo-dGTP pyrophosphatase MutT (NUDIX family)